MTGHRRIVMGAIVFLLLLLLAWGFMPKPVGVDTRQVVRDTLSVTVTEEGKTRVIDRYVVSAPIAGYVRRIELEVGDSVTAGQVVAHLDPMRSGTLDPRSKAEAQAAVNTAQASLSAATEAAEATRAEAELARNEYERVRRVANQGLLSQGALDAARAEWRSSQARLRSAEFNVEVARGGLEAAEAALQYSAAEPDGTGDHVSVMVTAPVDGRVLKLFQESEGAIAQGQQLIEIGDPQALEVEVEMLSADAVRVHEGMTVRLLRWGGDTPLDAVVKRVEPTGFTKVSALGVEEQRVLVICAISSDYAQWQSLGDGYRVEAQFILWEQADTLQVPVSALFRSGDGWSVFRVEKGRAVITQLELGRRSGLAAQVLSGLDQGDQVIIYPSDSITDGLRVEAR
ncbi:MAG: efflux RND transporter periplasmic adaptor subunit [Xanthomonadales bacterium]|nr:efflux RND transporter periplasmic adaptor subunit [Gammaproteobacteria bacterium]NNL94925.1 efflux RND transporter periplasmic adaptor subunit [Xanthomonadales bacterium]